MMGNGLQAKKMEAECGKAQRETHIQVNGKMEKYKDLESLQLDKEIDMKDNLKIR